LVMHDDERIESDLEEIETTIEDTDDVPSS
jgi:hypothetical protein